MTYMTQDEIRREPTGRLTDFVKTAREGAAAMRKLDPAYRQTIKVRGVKKAEALGVRELRTKKNTYQAVVFDGLGNVTVLDRKNRVFQLIGNEYQGR